MLFNECRKKRPTQNLTVQVSAANVTLNSKDVGTIPNYIPMQSISYLPFAKLQVKITNRSTTRRCTRPPTARLFSAVHTFRGCRRRVSLVVRPSRAASNSGIIIACMKVSNNKSVGQEKRGNYETQYQHWDENVCRFERGGVAGWRRSNSAGRYDGRREQHDGEMVNGRAKGGQRHDENSWCARRSHTNHAGVAQLRAVEAHYCVQRYDTSQFPRPAS